MVTARSVSTTMIAILATVFSACSGGSESANSTPPIADSPAPTTSTVGSASTIGGVIGEASEISCEIEYRDVQLAVEAYTLLNGEPPSAIEDLVPDFLRTISANYFIGINGSIETYDGACGGYVS